MEANVVSPSFFDMMGFKAIAGVTFRDRTPGGCRVGVLNEEASQQYFGGRPSGGAIIDAGGTRTTIVGVVQAPPLRTLHRRVDPAVYFPMTQDYVPRMTLIIGSRDTSAATTDALRTRLNAVPGGRSPVTVRTLEEHLSRVALAPERIAMLLIGACALIAMVLGGLGLYGAMIDAARQRRREFGVRIALGSQGWRLIAAVLAEGARLAAVGAIAGLLASRVAMRSLSAIVPVTSSAPVWAWVAAPVALLALVLVASVLPVRIALATDPLSVMRDE
jgi:predicted lysophospholipase L1 biosynthesis ABC-type transport system permease subunit